ncbi:histidine kinase dimerization/phosphoacceptor domain -containing protein [Flavilitoribacter nigricans]|uniref:histidine kinase n=1 Tax=Flavilitoribacter nigricans (strain ATCC 23147 / DSM 23189 / NBRC 102662 / NCIMB 1420 / SS-2) TaxID=1122177 RepID=A0A2D0N9T1_FLAN2|nr:histidine kinase dimerization/phosphoacceptor domain -containing protein [Flavilitoribacter nigricans]PHN05136.1 hypothetical protein CRP01_19135 [Flavilitoribacter nigricans DSM 23189 = NBRC 102662]
MKSAFYFACLLLLVSQTSLAQDDEFKKLPIDSALVWLNAQHVENPDGFHERALSTLAEAYQLNDDQLLGEAHLLLFRWHAYHVLFNMDSVIYHGEKAVTQFKITNDRANLAAVSAELAYEYQDENDLERCEELIFNAIAIYEDLGDDRGLGAAYHKLSRIFRSQKEPESAIKYALASLEASRKSEDHQTTALAWSVLILAYRDVGELDKAIEAGNNCIEILKNFVPEDPFTLARAYGYRGDAWAALGNYQKSLEDNQQSYAIVEAEIGAERPAAQTYRQGIGHAYFLQGNYEAALSHLQASIEGYEKLGQSRHPAMQGEYREIADCYYQLGDYQKAFLNQRIAHEIFDTLMQNRIANLESEGLLKYESGKKDQALEEQATIIDQKNYIQSMGIGLIGLLLLFLSTLFYYFRRNKKIAGALMVKNQENELLLKEIHHRVKNNLQTISSLLSLQSESISDQSALDAVQESKNRVASMALIHQKLYQGENLAAIEMRDYFKTIGKAIKDSFGKKAENVALEVDMSEIELDVDTAIPVGLITNELITNSLKHAFPNKQNGKILITLSQEKNGLLKLHIADNGDASANGPEVKQESGFGSLLIQLLTTQLGGTLKKSSESGTSTMIQFPLQEKSAA